MIKSSVYRLVALLRLLDMLEVSQHARGAMQQSDTQRKQSYKSNEKKNEIRALFIIGAMIIHGA